MGKHSRPVGAHRKGLLRRLFGGSGGGKHGLPKGVKGGNVDVIRTRNKRGKTPKHGG